ncbi:MAG: serine acetyltransferase [Anaerolineae bacterium]|nr:serine acetyltransferase [Anaerolineae bacterium]MBL6966435.1 serine acetyltransferase [Anaerolineales bacterium]
MDFITRLTYLRKNSLFGVFAYYALKLLGLEIPRSVEIGADLEIAHGGFGIVIHRHAEIGSRVKIYPGVTIGRADIYRPADQSRFEGIMIEDDVILSPGCKILCKDGILRVRRGAVIGANAVLLKSTEANEIWAGIPARCIGKREA